MERLVFKLWGVFERPPSHIHDAFVRLGRDESFFGGANYFSGAGKCIAGVGLGQLTCIGGCFDPVPGEALRVSSRAASRTALVYTLCRS